MKFREIILLLLAIVFLQTTAAQTLSNKPSNDFFSNVALLSKYLASKDFLQQRKNLPDIKAVDLIYKKSLELTGSISEALLTATFSTLPFKFFPLILPLSKLRINVPLPVGPLILFKKKIRRLPSHFFFDSPKTPTGDVDKLAHFFANAFLVYNLRCLGLSNFFGLLVELFERNLKVNGFVDQRDLMVNKLGALFGAQLAKNKSALPSNFFVIYDLNFLRINSVLQ